MEGEDRVGRALLSLGGRLDPGLKVPHRVQGEGDVAPRFLEARGPEGLSLAEPGDLANASRRERAVPGDPDVPQERRPGRAKDHLDPGSGRHRLDPYVLEDPGRVQELDTVPDPGAAQCVA